MTVGTFSAASGNTEIHVICKRLEASIAVILSRKQKFCTCSNPPGGASGAGFSTSARNAVGPEINPRSVEAWTSEYFWWEVGEGFLVDSVDVSHLIRCYS